MNEEGADSTGEGGARRRPKGRILQVPPGTAVRPAQQCSAVPGRGGEHRLLPPRGCDRSWAPRSAPWEPAQWPAPCQQHPKASDAPQGPRALGDSAEAAVSGLGPRCVFCSPPLAPPFSLSASRGPFGSPLPALLPRWYQVHLSFSSFRCQQLTTLTRSPKVNKSFNGTPGESQAPR